MTWGSLNGYGTVSRTAPAEADTATSVGNREDFVRLLDALGRSA